MATAAVVLAPPPDVVPPQAATTSTVAMANVRAKALRDIRLPPCLSTTKWQPVGLVGLSGPANAIGNRMLGATGRGLSSQGRTERGALRRSSGRSSGSGRVIPRWPPLPAGA